VLIPYLLKRNKSWHDAKLRIFLQQGHDISPSDVKTRVEKLFLDLFRMTIHSITIVNINDPPSELSVSAYIDMMQLQSPADVDAQIMSYIRLGEIVKQYSLDATIAVMSLPVPKRGYTSKQFMSIMESMSMKTCPSLFIRGNQKNVLYAYA